MSLRGRARWAGGGPVIEEDDDEDEEDGEATFVTPIGNGE